MRMYRISIIISVYRKIKELKLVLYALSIQSMKEFETIIADDGSGKEFEDLVREFGQEINYNFKYISQPHERFRKNRILNEAIKNANSNQLIFIDGDCIPHGNFIKAHCDNFKNNNVLCGRRVLLGEKLSSKFDKDFILNKDYEKNNFNILKDSLRTEKPSKSFEEGLIFKNKVLRRVFNPKEIHLLGCNFSISKELLEKVNRFDEDYIGAGIGEDTDLEYRLSLVNAKFVSVRNLAIVYHLYHKKTVEEKTNYEYFHNVVSKSGNYFCKNGLIKK